MRCASVTLVASISCSLVQDAIGKVGVNSDYKANDVEPRIINGEDANKDQNSFAQVSIHYSNGQHMCGASLVASDMILTAAHCAFDGEFVTVGQYDFGDPNESYAKFGILQRFVHPLFNPDIFRYDFALLKLDGEMDTTYPVSVLNSDASYPAKGQSVLALGWGATATWGDQNMFPDVLQQTTVKIISNSACSEFKVGGKERYKGEIFPEMVCAYTQGTDACIGDSGGPLLAKSSGTQVGLVSWGRGCAVYPGVYSRISSAYSWLRSSICAKSQYPPSYLSCGNGGDNGDGGEDRASIDNSLAGDGPTPVPAISLPVLIEIQLDDYSWETSWFLAYEEGYPIVQVSNGSYASTPGSLIQKEVVLPVGLSYTFVIEDSGRNGLCCKEENVTSGWYRLSVGDLDLVYGAGNFGSREERHFSLDFNNTMEGVTNAASALTHSFLFNATGTANQPSAVSDSIQQLSSGRKSNASKLGCFALSVLASLILFFS